MKKITLIEEIENRRPIILEGISKDLSYTAIAEQLGVHRYTVQSDIQKMQYNKDPELKRVYNQREEYRKSKRKKYAKRAEARFHGMTGISLEEKTFRNMIYFYKKEIGRIISSNNEGREISKLSDNIRKTLTRNRIITSGWGDYKLTSKARNFYNKEIRKREDN